MSFALLVLGVAVPLAEQASAQGTEQGSPAHAFEAVADRYFDIAIKEHADAEYQSALLAYKELLGLLEKIDYAALSLDEQVDHSLLAGTLKTRIFEIETVALHTLHPVSYFRLGQTNRLFIRPGAVSDAGVKKALAELTLLPVILKNAELNLKQPARVWTWKTRSTPPIMRISCFAITYPRPWLMILHSKLSCCRRRESPTRRWESTSVG